MPSDSVIKAILQNKCPACHEGDFFKAKNPYNLGKFTSMYDSCPKCNQKYTLEPGFYFGAAYVSYAFNVALFVAAAIIVYVFVEEATITDYVIALIVPSLLLAPVLYRLSRLVWASMFIPYKATKKKQL